MKDKSNNKLTGASEDNTVIDEDVALAADLPDTESIEKELNRENSRSSFYKSVRGVIFILLAAAAVAVLAVILLLPILRIYGKSMHGTLDEGDIVISVKTSDIDTGDIVAFYYNNNVLVKRVIAKSGDWVDIDSAGNVYVNNEMLDESYLSSKSYGDTNISLPYQVPEGRYFVMGDNREVSVDSRNTAIGRVSAEQIVGKVVFRIWPLNEFGPLH